MLARMQELGIVVFGAAVLSDGRPSPTLARRIGYAALAARTNPSSPILCSGAVGRAGPSEASVIARGLAERGVESRRLTLDEASRDTLQSVLAAVRFVRREALDGCVVCSDRYHIPRIRLLLGALGVTAESGPLPAGRGGTALRHWTRMRLREGLAIPYDLSIVLARRRALLRAIAEPAPRA